MYYCSWLHGCCRRGAGGCRLFASAPVLLGARAYQQVLNMCNEAFVDVDGLMTTRFGNRDRFGEEGRVNTKNSNQRQDVVVYLFLGHKFLLGFLLPSIGPQRGRTTSCRYVFVDDEKKNASVTPRRHHNVPQKINAQSTAQARCRVRYELPSEPYTTNIGVECARMPRHQIPDCFWGTQIPDCFWGTRFIALRFFRPPCFVFSVRCRCAPPPPPCPRVANMPPS